MTRGSLYPKKNIKIDGEGSKKQLSLFDDSEDDSETTPVKNVKPQPSNFNKKISLFDDDEDLLKEEENLFAALNKNKDAASKKPARGLFDDSEDIKVESKTTKNLFDDVEDSSGFVVDTEDSGSVEGVKKPTPIKEEKRSKSLFDDLESTSSPDDDLSNVKPKEQDIKVESKRAKSLFDDLESSNSVDDDLFKVKTETSGKGEVLRKPSSKDNPPLDLKSERGKSLFDDLESSNSVDNDLFSSKSDEYLTRPVHKENPPLKVESKTKNLFDDLESSNSVDDLFRVKTEDSQKSTSKGSSTLNAGNSLFDDLESSNSGDDDLFSSKKKVDNQEPYLKGLTANIASNNTESTAVKEELLDTPTDEKETATIVRKSQGLFDDSDTEETFEEDLFNKHVASTIPKKNDEDVENAEIITSFPKKNVSFEDDLSYPESVEAVKADWDSEEDQKNEKEKSSEESVSRVEQPSVNEPPPVINVFDPTPPPVDWDASSDNSADSDRFSLTDGILERTSYHQSQPTSSSIFDEAPPSLDMNYSSGIVKDVNATRLETDDSSFYPYASSSRRLSSDVFAEEQSQDSFFVTKNYTDSGAAAANLEQISEISESESKIEYLTTSAKEEDFEGSSSVFEHDSVENSEKALTDLMAPPPVLKRVSFLSSPPKEAEKPKPSTRTSPGKLKYNLNINVGALLPGATPSKTRNFLLEKPNSDETDRVADSPVVMRPAKAGPAIRPKSEITLSSGSFVGVDETEVLQSVTKDRARILVKRRPFSRRARQEAVRKSMTDFSLYKSQGEYEEDQSEDKVIIKDVKTAEVSKTIHATGGNLDCAVSEKDNFIDNNKKGSPKLPESSLNEEPEPKTNQKTQEKHAESDKSKKKGNIFEDSLEDELFKHAASLKQDTTARKPVNSDKLFDSASSEDEDLFSKDLRPVEKKVKESNPEPVQSVKADLFSKDLRPAEKNVKETSPQPVKNFKTRLFSDKSDSDSDSGLFSATQKSTTVSAVAAKASLFDNSDESSEDDLFGSKTSKGSSSGTVGVQGAATSSKRPTIKTANVKKLENKQVTDFDPLSGFK